MFDTRIKLFYESGYHFFDCPFCSGKAVTTLDINRNDATIDLRGKCKKCKFVFVVTVDSYAIVKVQ